MNKFLTMMLALGVMLFAVNSFAQSVPPSPAPASWISDTSGVLSADAHARLDTKLKQINQSSANEVAALIVPTLSGGSIEDLANATFKAWGVGKKNLDNGVLVVLAMKEHKSRIETGKGVEGDLPDLKTQDILQAARPWLRKGDVEGALGFIFDSSASAIANHKAEAARQAANPVPPAAPVAPSTSTSSGSPSCDVSAAGTNRGSTVLVLVMVSAIVVVALFMMRRRRRAFEETLAELRRQREAALEDFNRHMAEVRLRNEATLNSNPFVPAPPAPPAPVVVEPVVPVTPVVHRAKAVAHTSHPVTQKAHRAPAVATVAVTTAAALAAEEETRRYRREEEARRARDEEDRQRRAEEDRRRRERDEEDERRRRRDEESSSSSSSSSFDWGGGSSGGSSGGFGGGDSGGGGSSSDW